jgi:hypothetical protein
MSVYDTFSLGPVKFVPGMINSDSIDVTLDGEGIYISDGVLNIPVKLWEQMQDAAFRGS